jgi:hypothetical protein
MLLKKETEEQKGEQQKIDVLAAVIHGSWRGRRRGGDAGGRESRWEETRDVKWIAAHHGQTKVDLANIDFDALPSDWQKENRESAAFALEEVARAVKEGIVLDDIFVEGISARLHQRWASGTIGDILPGQAALFEDLSEEEKEKDRAIIRKAIEIS